MMMKTKKKINELTLAILQCSLIAATTMIILSTIDDILDIIKIGIIITTFFLSIIAINTYDIYKEVKQ